MDYNMISYQVMESYGNRCDTKEEVLSGRDLTYSLTALDSQEFEMPAVCH